MKKTNWIVVLGMVAGVAVAGEFGGVIKGTSGFEANFKSPAQPGDYANDPGGIGLNEDHEYDDGYVRDDGVGAVNQTTDWGVANKTQVAPAVGGYVNGAVLTFSSFKRSRLAMESSEDADGLEPGFELFYRTNPWMKESVSFGFVGALTYQRVSIEQSGIAFWQTETTTDTYTYNGDFTGVDVPNRQQPASGNFFDNPVDRVVGGVILPGGGWILPGGPDANPNRVTAGTQAYTYSREVDADLFGLKFGPNVEVMLIENLYLQLGVGASAQWIRSEFSYRDGAASGKTEDDGFLFGAYAQGDLQYAVSENWRVFVGAEWSTQESFKQDVDGYESELKGSSLVSGRFGISRSF